MDHILFVHSSINGHPGCFCLLVIVNNAVTKMGVQISFQDPAFIPSGKYPEAELLDKMVILFCLFICLFGWLVGCASSLAAAHRLPSCGM